jgi:acetyltransferase-like isoleucine patch superfamily enzyme
MKTLVLAFMRWRLKRAGVTCASDVRIRGMPLVYRDPQATIEIGSEVVLNSLPLRYHAHLHSPVKLLADKPGASITVGTGTRINGSCIHAVKSVSIGARCLLAAGVQVLDSNGHDTCMDNPARRIGTVDDGRPVVIEDDVWLGLNVIVMPGAHIGAGSIIGAGVIVSGVVPPRSIVKSAAPDVRTALATRGN